MVVDGDGVDCDVVAVVCMGLALLVSVYVVWLVVTLIVVLVLLLVVVVLLLLVMVLHHR